MAGLTDRLGAFVARRRLAATLWIALFLATPVVVYVRLFGRPLPVLAQLPPWELTDAHARPFGSTQLRGHVWIADFMFTSCPSICPTLSRHLARVQRATARYGSRVQLVSISVDPAADTPARLADYATRYGADPARWHFVTGAAPVLQHLAADGFRVALGEVPESADGRAENFNILHSARVMLIDANGRMRGVYRTNDEDFAELIRDTRRLTGW